MPRLGSHFLCFVAGSLHVESIFYVKIPTRKCGKWQWHSRRPCGHWLKKFDEHCTKVYPDVKSAKEIGHFFSQHIGHPVVTVRVSDVLTLFTLKGSQWIVLQATSCLLLSRAELIRQLLIVESGRSQQIATRNGCWLKLNNQKNYKEIHSKNS